jgi:hypothetical protein
VIVDAAAATQGRLPVPPSYSPRRSPNTPGTGRFGKNRDARVANSQNAATAKHRVAYGWESSVFLGFRAVTGLQLWDKPGTQMPYSLLASPYSLLAS